eukprot:CAMPEP_0183710494 /NCGR_PEP_ID=MMETSP0737-20130205/6212_1 /TAXON_ID=385413 /ORGANISM="Thalassiosira miniscula, Strain CCMP1093" /LENGTH=37 /DNA_ID= /DNA_START= /DNA_END= /DNA_ORIENTATION=
MTRFPSTCLALLQSDEWTKSPVYPGVGAHLGVWFDPV